MWYAMLKDDGRPWGAHNLEPEEISEEEINRYKHSVIIDNLLGCKDCMHCEQYADGKYYCTANGEAPVDPEEDFCDDFDDHRDWEESYRWHH